MYDAATRHIEILLKYIMCGEPIKKVNQSGGYLAVTLWNVLTLRIRIWKRPIIFRDKSEGNQWQKMNFVFN